MSLLCFSVFDKKASTYLSPFFMRSKGEALRAFMDLVADPQTSISRYPEDFSLYQLATFDETSGHFDFDKMLDLTPVTHLANATDFSKKD